MKFLGCTLDPEKVSRVYTIQYEFTDYTASVEKRRVTGHKRLFRHE